MTNILYANANSFEYFLNGVDITDEVLEYIKNIEETNILYIDLEGYFELFCTPNLIKVNYDEMEVYVTGVLL